MFEVLVVVVVRFSFELIKIFFFVIVENNWIFIMELVSGNDDRGELLLLMHIEHSSHIFDPYICMYMYLRIYLYNIFPNNVEEFILYVICVVAIFLKDLMVVILNILCRYI